MFGATSNFGAATSNTGMFGQPAAATTTTGTHNPMKDFEVTNPPDDSISSLAFSPATLSSTFLIAGSWDNNVRCWEVQNSGTVPKAQQTHQGPVLDVCWNDDGSKVFSASCDKTVKMWDLNSNQAMQVAQHEAPIRSVHYIKAPNYSCIMTGSWDKTLKFWDMRSANPMANIQLAERCFCADVIYPMVVVGLAGKKISIYRLENGPQEYKANQDSPLKFQHRCVAIFQDAKKANPAGYALGSIEGRCAIQFEPASNPKDNFTFKCHRSNGASTYSYQDIYAVNAIAFHPEHGTLATAGSNGKFSFWDKDARTKLKTSDEMENPITACTFDAKGSIFAYSVSYDWSKGHEFYNPQKKNYIFLRGNAMDELRPRNRKR